MRIVDNFLPYQEFKNIQSLLMGENFPWYYQSFLTTLKNSNKKSFQFIHWFLSDGGQFSDSTWCLSSCIEKLNSDYWLRIRANTTPGTVFHRYDAYHTDYQPPFRNNQTTAIYYVNTNNGYTKFKKGGKVKSVENRMVIFDTSLEHMAVSCTDQKTRVVINFNYYAR